MTRGAHSGFYGVRYGRSTCRTPTCFERIEARGVSRSATGFSSVGAVTLVPTGHGKTMFMGTFTAWAVGADALHFPPTLLSTL